MPEIDFDNLLIVAAVAFTAPLLVVVFPIAGLGLLRREARVTGD